MRQERVGGPTRQTSEIQDVHVDFAGAIAKRGRASDASLDSLDCAEQFFRRVMPGDSRGGVPELRLIRVTDRFGSVEGRHAAERCDAGNL